ncbi:helix-turn-helix transcriptional regulator [Actinomyces sp. B33]|uniref:helix-turn-helix transcriptional regulator n=1 Tax=Actinomyces sp. B33 TaxID=2942131 RepID=UPI003FA4B1D2
MTTPTITAQLPTSPYLLSTEQAGEYLAVSPDTLRTWRCRGRGPAYVAVSARNVRYRVEDLRAWADAHLVGGGRR